MFTPMSNEFSGNVQATYCCLSSDTKPTEGMKNGSTIYEMDTKKGYVFDEENKQWLEIF